MNRKLFLTDFLGALGAKEILFSDIGPDTVTGTVVYGGIVKSCGLGI